jgi:hypothetical protein
MGRMMIKTDPTSRTVTAKESKNLSGAENCGCVTLSTDGGFADAEPFLYITLQKQI